jgi:stage II sporulation protein AA (anti-sigma F factor antagonist)
MIIECKRSGPQLTVGLSGELDHHSAKSVRNKLNEQMEDSGIKRIVFDFKGLTLMDSSGIGVIIGQYKRMQKRNGSVEVKNISRSIDRIMAMSGLYNIIKKIS